MELIVNLKWFDFFLNIENLNFNNQDREILCLDCRFVDWRKGFLALALMSTPIPTQHQKEDYINLITKGDGSLMQKSEYVKVSFYCKGFQEIHDLTSIPFFFNADTSLV